MTIDHNVAQAIHRATPQRSLVMSVLMTPDMANFSGNVHGGAILKILDQVAFACASSYARSYVVPLWVDRVLFRDIIHVGELVTFSASVNYTGRTSMEVGIRVDRSNIQDGTARHTNSSYFTMVAVDSSSEPTEVPPLIAETPTEIQRYESARRRRKAQREQFESPHACQCSRCRCVRAPRTNALRPPPRGFAVSPPPASRGGPRCSWTAVDRD